jgi:hypothetical protein
VWENSGTASILSNKGRATIGASGTNNLALGSGTYYDFDYKMGWTASNITSYDSEIVGRWTGNATWPNDSWIRGGIDTSAADTVYIGQKIKGSQSDIASGAFAVSAGADYWMRLWVKGTSVKFKMWLKTDPEPVAWTLTATTTLTTTGLIGVQSFATTAVNFDYTALTVGEPDYNGFPDTGDRMPYTGGGYYA